LILDHNLLQLRHRAYDDSRKRAEHSSKIVIYIVKYDEEAISLCCASGHYDVPFLLALILENSVVNLVLLP
jgi:hypothetical protein